MILVRNREYGKTYKVSINISNTITDVYFGQIKEDMLNLRKINNDGMMILKFKVIV